MFHRFRSTWIAAVLALLGWWSAGCKTNVPDPAAGPGIAPHSDAHYAFLFGQRYRTKVDLYIFFFSHEPDYKYIGTRADNRNFGPKELPAEIASKNIGQTYEHVANDGLGDVVILDVAPAGAVLTINTETHDVTPLSGVRDSGGYPMGFICDLSYSGKTNSVFSEFVQSHKIVTGKVPNQDISTNIAEKIQ